jgi:hypothetical protein
VKWLDESKPCNGWAPTPRFAVSCRARQYRQPELLPLLSRHQINSKHLQRAAHCPRYELLDASSLSFLWLFFCLRRRLRNQKCSRYLAIICAPSSDLDADTPESLQTYIYGRIRIHRRTATPSNAKKRYKNPRRVYAASNDRY